MAAAAALLCLLAAAALPAPAPAAASAAAPTAWTASWVRTPGSAPASYGVYHFRRAFDLPARPPSFRVHVSADNRYQLFVNGTRVARGPAKSDLQAWPYDTIDLAPHLRAGRNVLAAVVWDYGELAATPQHLHRAALMVQGSTRAERIVDTGPAWRTARNEAFRPIGEPPIHVGPGDAIDGRRHLWGWEQPAFDDRAWGAAVVIGAATPKEAPNNRTYWFLVPRNIPMMEERPERIAKVRQAAGVTPPPGFPARRAALQVPPRTKVRLLLDQTHLTTAYPELVLSGGEGARVRLAYAENLWGKGWDKGHRDQIEGKEFRGYYDEVIADGGVDRVYETLWWRTYRYLELTVETAQTPLTIVDLRATYTGYPLERRARWKSDAPDLDRILDVGWRTARLCAHETYMDCPYWEQLQYVGDTRIQALVSLYTSGDDRLMRNAIEQFDRSRLADQPTTSRYPSRLPQYIPPFSLWWIGMVWDHWWYRGDAAFVRRMLPGVRAVLAFFAGHQRPTGEVGRLPYWNFVDWAVDWRAGVPPGWNVGFVQGTPKGALPRDNTAIGFVPASDPKGSSASIDLQLLLAYDWAAALERAAGSRGLADEHARAAEALRGRIRQLYWSDARKLFADTPHLRLFSQQANALAVLGRVVEGKDAAALVERMLGDGSLTQATLYFRHYVHEAVSQVGLGDRYLELLAPWRQLLAQGVTTWPETQDPSRSDCHAWGASPNFELYRTVLGIDAAAPGFARVRLRPSLGTLKTVAGSIPHPKGELSASFAVGAGGAVKAEVSLPPTIDGELLWRGRRHPLRPGANRLTLAP